jgi:hypothetical protein
MIAFWDIALYNIVVVDRRFRYAYCLHHQGLDGHSTHLWNVGILQRDYTQYPRRLSFSVLNLFQHIESAFTWNHWCKQSDKIRSAMVILGNVLEGSSIYWNTSFGLQPNSEFTECILLSKMISSSRSFEIDTSFELEDHFNLRSGPNGPLGHHLIGPVQKWHTFTCVMQCSFNITWKFIKHESKNNYRL